MDAEKIARKIAGLLSKTVENGATEAEAIAAAKLAQKLMAKYHVSSVDVDTAEAIAEEGIDVVHRWEMVLAQVVAKCFCCRGITVGKTELITGRDSDRKAAINAIKMFMAAGKAGLRRARKEAKERYGTTRGVESSYGFSFARTVENELTKQAKALMLVVPEEVTESFHTAHPNIRTTRTYIRGNAGACNFARNRGEYDGRVAAGKRRINE